MKWQPAPDLFSRKISGEETRNLIIIWAFIAFASAILMVVAYREFLSQIPIRTISIVILGLVVATVLLALTRKWLIGRGQSQSQKLPEQIFIIFFSALYGLFLNLFFLLWLAQLIDGGMTSEVGKVAQFFVTVTTLQGATLLIWIYLPDWLWRISASLVVILLLPMVFNQPEFFPENIMRTFKVGSYDTELPVSEDTYQLLQHFGLDEQNCEEISTGKTHLCELTVLSSIGANIFVEFKDSNSNSPDEPQDTIRLELPKEAPGPRAFREVQPGSSNQQ